MIAWIGPGYDFTEKMIILIFFLTVICSYQILVEIDLNFNGF